MKLRFNINYHTEWGENLYLCGDIPELGGGDPTKAVEMQLGSPDSWYYHLKIDRNPGDFNYWFIVKAPNKAWRFEWGKPHRFVAGAKMRTVDIFSNWQDLPSDKPFYSSAFTKGMLRREHRDQPLKGLPASLTIRVEAPLVAPEETLVICGEGRDLGNWDPKKGIVLNDAHFPVWEVNLPLPGLNVPFEYKFVIVNKNTREARLWETSNNRLFGVSVSNSDDTVVVEGLRFNSGYPTWKGAGTAIPVFSIRTEEDFGVGDFADIKKMVDWCVMTGQKILQLLPVNDTTKSGTWVDSYPYSANSTFALHPMYIRLEAAGSLKDKGRRDYYRQLGKELNELPQIDYERVNNAKIQYLRELYAERGADTATSPDFKKFVEKNEYWLKPYSVWCALRDEFHSSDISHWGKYAVYNEKIVDEFCDKNKVEIGFYYFVQYHLDKQLREARDYAHLHRVVLKGDIPIGIGRESVDAWKNPELFNLDAQAGAPPDDFSVLGQNWGFPTYNWDKMAEDGFAWWKDRFRKMAEYFDAYRIDHILGFFRIWQIPLNAIHGLLGYFNPALPFSPEELRHNYDFWIDPDLQTNPLIFDWMLGDFFGEFAEEAKREFLEDMGMGRYRLKEFVDTQVKVEKHFADLERNDQNTRIKEALMGLIDDVLFIEDPYNRGQYHPRIAAQFTYQYRRLTDYEKWQFNRLYNDFFYHRNDEFWKGKAMWKLPPLIDSTSMLTCAEDLGMIPDCVPQVMHDLEILSLEIQRMPKTPGLDFGDTWSYPYYSVCTTSTHDMGGIRLWWEQNHDISQRFYNEVLHEGGEAPQFAEPWICDKIVELQLKSPSMLCILPLQDWLATDGELRRDKPADEQINEPANSHHYWRYRMHLTVERLIDAKSFNDSIKSMIEESNR